LWPRSAPRAGEFSGFQYPTLPLHVSDDFMNTMLRKALAPALDPAASAGKDR
jgi:hypothetical protein